VMVLVIFPCHWHLPLYDVGYVSTSNRCCCACFVVGFRLPLDLCLCGRRFLGEAVWRDSFGGGVVVEGWCWWFVLRWLWWRRSCVAVVVFRFLSVYVGASLVGFWMGGHRSGVETLCGREFFSRGLGGGCFGGGCCG